jgi:phosphopantothenoylcysteine decarboxylase/phosphopantothenate--cysteine ligase
VVSAQEMYDVCHQYFNEVDVVIAASRHYAKACSDAKIKKSTDNFVIEPEKTKDILAL